MNRELAAGQKFSTMAQRNTTQDREELGFVCFQRMIGISTYLGTVLGNYSTSQGATVLENTPAVNNTWDRERGDLDLSR